MIGRTRVLAVLLLLLTFSVGGVAGMALEEGLGLDWFDFLDEDSAGSRPLLEGLDLSAEQRTRVDAVLARQEQRLEGYWEARVPEIQAILEGSYDEIRGILEPGQQQRFDERVRGLRGRVPLELGD